ncbi:PHP domain-containing protein [Cohnella cellulosilytica]|uniref:Histidinol-phosphatase n=1 Tax=Cohnella cellulosilytica TaxID=986710 RepID=A0ABW2F5T6_9BACL
MKVDMHFHLEEGPYSLRWLSRTLQALAASGSASDRAIAHSRAWAEDLSEQLEKRMWDGCFSEEWLDRYLDEGRARGIGLFGVVDHLYRFRECRPYYEKHMLLDDSPIGCLQQEWLNQVCVASLEEFVTFVTDAKRSRPDLRLGVEADFFEGGEAELGRILGACEWDYVIGSVHFLDGWGFDNPDTRSTFERMDPLKTYARYYDLLGQACRSGLFDLIAHPDNLKAFGFRPADEKELLPLYRRAAEELVLAGAATEINTGLAYRYPVAEPCPSPLFLSVLAEHNVPITLSSDAHYPDDIGRLLDEASAAALKAGYREWTVFEGRKARTVPIAESSKSRI